MDKLKLYRQPDQEQEEEDEETGHPGQIPD